MSRTIINISGGKITSTFYQDTTIDFGYLWIIYLESNKPKITDNHTYSKNENPSKKILIKNTLKKISQNII